MKSLISSLFLCAALASAQTSNYPGSLDTNSTLFVTSDNVQTTLTSPMQISDNVAVVASSTGFAVNSVATVCDTVTSTGRCTAWEHMLVTAVNGNVLTVTRAFAGTSAVAHATGRPVALLIDAVHQTALKAAVINIETALGANLANVPGTASGGIVPVNKGGTGVSAAQGVGGSKVQLAAGNPTTGNLLKYDSNGSAVDSGLPSVAQGTGTKVQLANGPPTAGNVPKFDASGALVDSGLTPASGPIASGTYNWSQNPSGSIAIGSNTVSLTPCPVGLSGSDTNHWLYLTGPSGPTTIAVQSGTNTTSPTQVVVTTQNNHNLTTGNFVTLSGMSNPSANGPWQITVTGAKTFQLNNSNNNGANQISVIGASNASPIVINTSTGVTPDNGFQTGDTVTISGVTGNTAANGTFIITRTNANTFSLNGSTGNGVYGGGGIATGTYTSTSGVVSIGPESVLVNGGTCTSGAASGNITFLAANTHATGYTIQSATAGTQEAINAAVATGLNAVQIPSGNTTWYQGVTMPSNFAIYGTAGSSIVTLSAGYPTVNLIQAAGSATATTTTSTTALLYANRSLAAVDNITVASAAGFSVGDYVLMTFTETTYSNAFNQVDVIKAINGSTITFRTPVLIPLDTTQVGNIVKLSPVKNIIIRDLILDGGAQGYAQYANLSIFGIYLHYVTDSTVQNVQFRNWTRDASLMADTGHNNTFGIISSVNGGSGGYNDQSYYNQTNLQAYNLTSSDSPGFGPGFYQTVGAQVTNVRSDRSVSRAMKVSGLAWSSFTNITLTRSTAGNGLAITQGSYRNQFRNVVSTLMNNNEGIWFSSQDNQYNIIDGLQCVSPGPGGSGGQCLIIYNADHDNTARNISSPGDVLDLGTNNSVGTATTFRSFAHNSANQSIPNTTQTSITFDTNDFDVGGIHSTSVNTSRFTLPAGSGGSTVFTNGGTYMLSGQIAWAANATGQRIAQWLKNGTTVLCQSLIQAVTVGGASTFVQVSCPAVIGAGEYVELRGFQDSGGALNALTGSGLTYGSITRMF